MHRELLQRWMYGELGPAEEAALIRQLEERTDEELEELFPAEEWERTLPMLTDARRRQRTLRAVHAATGVRGKSWWKRHALKAACIAGVLALGAYFTGQQRMERMAAGGKPVSWNMIATKDGTRKMITLADGTRISLNGGSQVDIPETFADGRREIRLIKGEIFLEVAPDAKRPFMVLSEKVKIQVLGTSFNVRGYTEEGKMTIAVRTGKISVHARNGGPEMLLTPGVQVVLSDSAFATKVLKEPGMIGGWKNNELWYEGDMLKDVFRDLAYNYGLRFQVRDSSVLHKHINAMFIKRSKEDIIRILAKMADFSYTIREEDIIIY